MTLGLYDMRRRFGRKLVLDGVTLEVRPGECYALVGENGAGKTTLLRMALGLDPRGNGQVFVDGFDARREGREARARVRGLIEVPGAWTGLSGPANLQRLLRLAGLDRRAARGEAQDLLALVGLGKVGKAPVRAWSLGMRQRLGLAAAMVGDPDYLLLDEPLSHLDPGGIAEMRESLLAAVRERGLGLLVSSHQLVEVEPWCDRVGVLHEGVLLAEEDLAQLKQGAVTQVRLATRDDEHALGQLAHRHWKAALDEKGLTVDLAGRPSSELAREVIEAGCELESLVPQRPSLEHVYLDTLRANRDHAAEPLRRPAAPSERRAPDPRRAPSQPARRAARYELASTFGWRQSLVLVGLPCLLALLAVRKRYGQALEEARAIGVESISATSVTGFEGVAVALRASLPLAALILAGLASQSIAGELSRGTLRNLLLAPIGRPAWIAGKALAWIGVTVVVWGALNLTAWLAAWSAFAFGDVVEILPNGEPYPLVPADELWPMLRTAVTAPLLPLAACTAIGFLAGALARHGASAIAAAWGALVALDLARAPAREWGFEAWLPTSYLSTPLGDRSFLKYFHNAAQGSLDARFAFETSQWIVPTLWCLACFVGAFLIWLRRPVP